MNEQAIEAIEEFYYDSLFEPNRKWPKEEFDRRVYSRWAAQEILERIIECPVLPAQEIVQRFIDEMKGYLELDLNKQMEFIFSTALETTEDIGSILV